MSSTSNYTGITTLLGVVALFKFIEYRNKQQELNRFTITQSSSSSSSSSCCSSKSASESSCCSSSSPTLSSSSSSTIPKTLLLRSPSQEDKAMSDTIRRASIAPSSLSKNEALQLQPLVICGPSGVGKGTLIGMLLNDYVGFFGKSISHTTRAPRKGEVDGVSYHFTTREAIKEKIAKGEMIEHAEVHTNIYGTSKQSVADVAKSGKICILEIDYQGAQVVKKDLHANCLFISPPSLQILKQRLTGRGTEAESTIKTRLATAERELDFESKHPEFFVTTIVNDDLQVAYNKLETELKKLYPQLKKTTKTENSTK